MRTIGDIAPILVFAHCGDARAGTEARAVAGDIRQASMRMSLELLYCTGMFFDWGGERLPREEAVMDTNAYAELRKRLGEAGLFQLNPWFYIGKSVLVCTLLLTSLALLIFYEGFWGQMMNAGLLAFAFCQAGFIMHPIVHKPVLSSRWMQVFGSIFNFVFGWNVEEWREKHNKHHRAPNQSSDPDAKIRFLAFTPEQAREKRGMNRVITRYQHVFFLILLLGELWHLRVAMIRALWKKKQETLRVKWDLFLLYSHFKVYFGLLFLFLPWSEALAFVALHTGLVGLYLGGVFTTNHVGMPSVDTSVVPDFFRQQVLATRDIRGGWMVSFFFGELNFQVAHHLFPWIPGNNLRAATIIVEGFCREQEVRYHATSVWGACWEIWCHLREIAQYARPHRTSVSV